MTTVTLGGNPVQLRGEIPVVNDSAPDFQFVKDDLSDAKFSDYAGKTRIIISVPSLGTSVCQTETRTFNQKISGIDNTACFVVSMDLPFAMKNFCETEGLDHVINASDFRFRELGANYNVEMIDGKFKGLLARAVWVVNPEGTIVHAELVPEIGQEPDYDKALDAIRSIN